jgi:opacity protein-like surface antigen
MSSQLDGWENSKMRMTFKCIKNWYFVVMGLFFISPALADGQFIYLGGAPVYSWTHFNWSNADTTHNTDPEANGDTILDSTTRALQAEVFVGYEVVVSHISLAVEGATQFGKRTTNAEVLDAHTQEPLSSTVKINKIYIVDFRPGFLYASGNLYGIVGVNSANFEATQENDEGLTVQDSDSIRRTGLRFGAGYSWLIAGRLAVRVDYVYTHFSNFQFSDVFPNSKESHTWSVGADSSEVSAGLAITLQV